MGVNSNCIIHVYNIMWSDEMIPQLFELTSGGCDVDIYPFSEGSGARGDFSKRDIII